MVDICNEDLYILDPQFEEKDELDLLTTGEVIADFGVVSVSTADETDQRTNEPCATSNSDNEPNDNHSVASLLVRISTEQQQSMPQLNGSRVNSKIQNSSPANNNRTTALNTNELDRKPSTLTVNTGFGDFPSHNGSIGFSPLPSPSSNSIDSPPRSPRRGQKKSQSYFLQNQLMADEKG